MTIALLITFVCFSTNTFATTQEYNILSEQECQARVAEIMSHYDDNPKLAKQALNAIDVVLIQEPTVTYYNHTDGGISPYGINPTDYSFSVYGYSHKVSTNIWLQWRVDSNRNEWFSGPLDYVSLEYDTAVASYISSNGDENMSTVKAKNTGIVLFNVEDSKLKKNTYTYGSVNVKAQSGKWLNFGSKYVHTYTSFLVSGEASYAFSPSSALKSSGEGSLGLSYTFGYKVNVGTNTSKWQIWTDNSILPS